jgi:hypothetical protein
MLDFGTSKCSTDLTSEFITFKYDIIHTVMFLQFNIIYHACPYSDRVKQRTHSIKYKSQATFREKCQNPTCFGTGLLSSSGLLEQRNASPTPHSSYWGRSVLRLACRTYIVCSARIPEDGTPVPKRVEVWYCHKLYFIECIRWLIHCMSLLSRYIKPSCSYHFLIVWRAQFASTTYAGRHL